MQQLLSLWKGSWRRTLGYSSKDTDQNEPLAIWTSVFCPSAFFKVVKLRRIPSQTLAIWRPYTFYLPGLSLTPQRLVLKQILVSMAPVVVQSVSLPRLMPAFFSLFLYLSTKYSKYQKCLRQNLQIQVHKVHTIRQAYNPQKYSQKSNTFLRQSFWIFKLLVLMLGSLSINVSRNKYIINMLKRCKYS